MEKLTEEFVNQYFPSVEGEAHQVYGKVKNGKTLFATTLAWADLMKGYTVAANWKIFWPGYDERENRFLRLLGVLGIKKYFAKIPKENFIYLDPADEDLLLKLKYKTDLKVYLDEGHMYLDSYKKTDFAMDKRNIVLFTGHFNRTITVISQRPTAIHATFRGNVNRFFKVQKERFLFFWIRFRVFEIQDMIGESPDENSPEREFTIWGRKSLYAKYDFKSMRGDIPRSQPNYAEVWELSWKERIKQLFYGKDFDLLDTPPLPPLDSAN